VSALNAVLAQRLVRLTCKHCAQPFTPDAATLARHGVLNGNHEGRGLRPLPRHRLQGRRAVAELLCWTTACAT
jgi:general secretion pathway protein E